MLDLDEVRRLWGLSVYAIYKYAQEHPDQLHTYGRPGKQRYYSYAELKVAFGDLDQKLFETERMVDTELLRRLNRSGSEFGTRAA